MKSISSRDNGVYKELKQLAASAQARRKAGRSLLDGVHLAEAYLQQGGTPEQCVVAESALYHAEVAPLLAQCEAAGSLCICLPDALYQALSQVENGVGLLLVIATPQPQAPSVLATSAVLLDGLQDPGNLGSILRSAAAAGIRQVFCSAGTVGAWSPKVLRAGMGAHFLLQIFEGADLLSLSKASKIPVLATSSYAQETIYQIDLTQEVAWLFGHEGQGVADDLMEAAGIKVVIPHLGQMESLNVAAAAAVCFFEQARQRQGGR
ncbi:TrmH family RNA methyltransferase [Herbaspirillum rhizosphaerae]|uniref:TrmH family RNA methyltransferase n=1 Tax=Herbaspirillum rhizosphaerae TaxID=346179 RepID=UPI00067DF5A1|nr:RNA methyltransferase [Herbaspirillum rhizosphaerae]